MKKKLSAIFALVLAFLICPKIFAAENSYEIFDNTGNRTWVLSDSSRKTALSLKEGDRVEIRGQGIKGLYLRWDKYPEKGIKVTDREERSINTGFLHENIETENEGKIVIEVNSECILCDALPYGEKRPSWVQVWEENTDRADVLLLSTHADDELLYLGGALAELAHTEGISVQVAYMVNHNDEPWRNHELLNGLYEIGVRRYPVIPKFPDIYCYNEAVAREIYDAEEISAYHRELLERFSPQVVIHQDFNGEYGHGAHILNAKTMAENVKESEVKKAYSHLYKEHEIIIDDTVPLDERGRNAFQLATDAYNCHKSQLEFFTVENFGQMDMRKYGLYYSTVGFPEEDSLLKGIVPYEEQERIADEEARKKEEERTAKEKAEREKAEKEALQKAEREKEEYKPESTNTMDFVIIGSPKEWLSLLIFSLLIIAASVIIIKKRRKAKRK